MMRRHIVWLGLLSGMIFIGILYWFKSAKEGFAPLRYEDLSKSHPYDELARATGGRVYSRSGEELTAAVAAGLNPILEDLKFRKYELLASLEGDVPGGATEIPLRVDPTLKILVVSLSALNQVPEVTFHSPGGKVVTAESMEVGKSGKTWTVTSPEPGPWRLKLVGRSNVHLEVRGDSGLRMEEVQFVRPGGRPGHTGLFPYSGRLKPGATEKLEVRLESGARPLELEASLLSRGGASLVRSHKLEIDETSGSTLSGYASIEIPKEPFRVFVSGKLQLNGKEFGFQRLDSTLFPVDRPEMRIFSFQKESASEDLCRRMTLGKIQIFTAQDPDIASYGASASVNCVNVEGKLHYSGTYFLPLPEQGTSTLVFTTSPSDPLTSEECATAAEIQRHVPSRLKDAEGPQLTTDFRCEKRTSGILGILTLRITP